MPKIKTAGLIGPALDWAVAKCEGKTHFSRLPSSKRYYSPSTNGTQARPIIEREEISIIRVNDDWGVDEKGFCDMQQRIPVWCATDGQMGTETSTEHQHHDEMFQIYESEVVYGPTPLVAAMRCYVARKLGKEIDIPDELLEDGGTP